MRRPIFRDKSPKLRNSGTILIQERSRSMPMHYANNDLRVAHLTMVLRELDELRALSQSITNPKQLADVKNLIAQSRKLLSELMDLFDFAGSATSGASLPNENKHL